MEGSYLGSTPRQNDDLLNWSAHEAANNLMKSRNMVLEDLSNIQHHLNSNYEALQSKLMQDRALNESHKENQFKIKTELEQSKMALMESYKSREDTLLKELSESKHQYESIILEKEKMWQERLELKDREVSEVENLCKESTKAALCRMKENEDRMISNFATQEQVWLKKISDMEEAHRRQLVALTDKHAIEMANKDLINKGHNEALELKLKQHNEKKMRKLERQIEEVMQHYKDKELKIQGSLEEARRETLLAQTTFATKEEAMREELQLKDSRLISIQSRLNTLDDYIKIADLWRHTARDLAAQVIQCCASIQELPNVPDPPQDSISNTFQGFVKEEEINKSRRRYQMELDQFYRVVDNNSMVNKKLLTKALKTSKKIIERIQAEILPKIDNIGVV